jgi:hypothetical protein
MTELVPSGKPEPKPFREKSPGAASPDWPSGRGMELEVPPPPPARASVARFKAIEARIAAYARIRPQ